jgi:hypothetical protein
VGAKLGVLHIKGRTGAEVFEATMPRDTYKTNDFLLCSKFKKTEKVVCRGGSINIA